MSKYNPDEPKPYAVYKIWKGSKIEQVLEYFETVSKADEYAKSVPLSSKYDVHVGKFITSDE